MKVKMIQMTMTSDSDDLEDDSDDREGDSDDSEDS